jgi:hypothetical protein
LKFLIYAMPRSGGAWLANFLTYDGLICHHEPLGKIPPEDMWRLDAAVDTSAYLFREKVKADKYFALVRDVAASNAALVKLGLPPVAEPQVEGVPVFRYESLFDVGYLEDLWGMVRGDGFNRERAKMLIELNVQHRLDMLWGNL